MPANTSQFTNILVTDAGGTQRDVGPYITAVDPKRSSQDTNLTTFATAGGPVTENHIRGAGQSEFPLKGLFDPAYTKTMRQVVAARSGTAIVLKGGANTTPGQGDEVFSATMCPISYTLTYKAGSPATLDFDLKLADGAGNPQFGTV